MFTILTPIIIAVSSYKYNKKLERKNSNDNRINRLANFYSCINFSHDEKSVIKWNWSYLKNINQYWDIYNFLKEKGANLNEFGHAFSFTIFLNSITNIIPTQVLITDLTFCVSSYTNNVNSKELNAFIKFESGDNKYKSISIKNNGVIGVPILCMIDKKENEKLKEIIKDNQEITIILNIKIKNQFNIVTKCELRCTYTHNLTDKEIGELKVKDSFIKILNTFESM